MLGDAACLQSLALEHVSWGVSGSCVVRPGVAFRHLRHLDVVACTDNLALSAAVLSSAVATGGGGTRCSGRSHERA
ncbi:uncharacterized protein PHACADRAFT_264323 [Phanerochaete carnosa HHB-10118-sp]|uniref:Uncharacterized protein n=1 Tax=Phanerochaete carnosa (strain HHB-10118-sp) TaxID=650164 RepID=K5VHU0_PHACS|nr:uncharacterized protein PHACADRAFT_264323 [Phanerochaete carnosa HHB-10118-sp]EKM50803.1 hypothetical protein PHACADRAFT_264323 [Phanerochaete carnosa HHB-10118-sp]